MTRNTSCKYKMGFILILKSAQKPVLEAIWLSLSKALYILEKFVHLSNSLNMEMIH